MEGNTAVDAPPASPAAPQTFQFTSPAKVVTTGSPCRSPAKHGTVGPRRNRCSRRVPAQEDPKEANPDANLHEALELVLAYEQDIRTLVKCTALNQHFQQYVQERAQQNARTLLASWKQTMPQKAPALPQKQRMVNTASTGTKDHKLQCLLWLCRTAGAKFVNSHDVACSLLDVFRDAPGLAPERLAAGLKEAGLELTAALLVYACQAQLPDVPFLLRHLNHCPGLHAYKVLALQQKAGARPATEVLQRVRGVLRHVTAANLPDLLSITLSYCPIETARDGASILLDHDRDHLHLLHTDKAQGVTAAAAAPAQPLINSAEDDSTTQELSVDGIAYVQRTTSHLAVAPIAQVMRPALLLATWRLCTGW